jgi:hypothetical protein
MSVDIKFDALLHFVIYAPTQNQQSERCFSPMQHDPVSEHERSPGRHDYAFYRCDKVIMIMFEDDVLIDPRDV